MRSRLSLFVVMIIGSVLALAGCGSTDASGAAASGSDTRSVRTEQGTVEIPAEPKRVVVLNHALAGYLFDLDVPVVATVSEDADREGEFSPFWEEKANENGTRLLEWGTDGFDYEAILEADPDLIVGGGAGLPSALATKAYDRLGDIAPTVLVSGSLATWQEQFRFLAEDVFDEEAAYADHLSAYESRVAEVKDAITPPPGPAAHLTITADGTPYVLFENTGLPQMLGELGIAPAPLVEEHDLQPYKPGGDMAELSTEQVGQLLRMPTVFVTGFNADTTDVATLSRQSVYAKLPAFENDNAYDLPYWTVRGDYDEAMALLDIIEKQFS
ncbi:ferric enterobactin (enterochelin)-binding protein [Prauserella marina]|uniref:Iron complex transport system substrate-binding protein n=1 Tax=Prauserella marina TaxID=530584 RepID=A0A222VP63_9PSEU|nr:ABC transporter substrate-binding protein [Prauserella marina]ASR35674.1 ferric enterobactin (enterochelin)-binding protein [Prauserella marina]PWV84450.1 iron complex transport system substrate-binding protein [Prauserella marina]SDC22274.1 iron complex transport system substrate-binding protein [Prauserella marina]